MEIVNFLNENFWKDSDYFLLLMLSVVFVLVTKEGEKRGKRLVIYTILVLVFVILNPIVARIGLRFFGEDKYAYMRIYYLVPLMTLIPYAGTEFYTLHVKRNDKRSKKMLYALILCITIVMCGKTYDSTMYRDATNIYKIDQNALEISDMINEDCNEAQVRIYAPSTTDIHYGIRQYAGNIIIAGDSMTISTPSTLQEVIGGTDLDYIVLAQESNVNRYITQKGFEQLGESGEYIVYKKKAK